MDLAYLREHPETIDRLIEHQRIRTGRIFGGEICIAERWTLDDGIDLFAKSRPAAPTDFFSVEAAGLRWLAEAEAVPVPEVIGVTQRYLVLEWVPPGTPNQNAARALGHGLAALHRAGAPRFGADRPGYIGSLPLDNQDVDGSWPRFFVERRLRPFLRSARDAHTLDAAHVETVERVLRRFESLAGPAEPPARIHGDLWSSNVHYGVDGQAWLVDPAAQGGHRETDLATLALFGAPYLDEIVAAYNEVFPLAEGWRERVPLHQLHLLLVHVVMFGTSYVDRTLAAARALL